MLAVLALMTGTIAVIAINNVLPHQRSAALTSEKETRKVASRENVSLARYAEESGKKAQALAHLAQALRLNPENREASSFAVALLTQLSWHVPSTVSMRHHARVHSAQFSPNGQRVVTASADNTARLWDAASGKPIGPAHEARTRG